SRDRPTRPAPPTSTSTPLRMRHSPTTPPPRHSPSPATSGPQSSATPTDPGDDESAPTIRSPWGRSIVPSVGAVRVGVGDRESASAHAENSADKVQDQRRGAIGDV